MTRYYGHDFSSNDERGAAEWCYNNAIEDREYNDDYDDPKYCYECDNETDECVCDIEEDE